jgi:hypothetical protein
MLAGISIEPFRGDLEGLERMAKKLLALLLCIRLWSKGLL